MPKRDHESNRQRQSLRFSRKVRKPVENSYRKYLNDPRKSIRIYLFIMFSLNRAIIAKGRKRSNTLNLAFEPGSSYRCKNPNGANLYIVNCHGNHMISKAG